MNSTDSRQNTDGPDDDSTGIPFLPNWPALYAFVVAIFILLVALLWLLTYWGGGGAK
ncbi:MAG TPA: hypothetical protein VGN88_11095 [Phycisphaerae bacterium]|jgi:hypothetical protein